MYCHKKPKEISVDDKCCTANTGCKFDGTLRKVVAEPIYVQKVYDSALFNLQGLRSIPKQSFTPSLGGDAKIIKVLDVRCRKFFNPSNINDPKNLKATPTTTISGGQLVTEQCGTPVETIGPDGKASENIIFADTSECDEKGKGTPIFGTQNVTITGDVVVEIDVLFTDNCDARCRSTLVANVPIGRCENPLLLTNFFELCVPSVYDSAFLPRFTEFCNVSCEARLASNSILRDITITPSTGKVKANLIIALCVSCEKKIIVPVQLCVLSTGFPRLEVQNQATLCPEFPQLFPDQIDETAPSTDC